MHIMHYCYIGHLHCAARLMDAMMIPVGAVLCFVVFVVCVLFSLLCVGMWTARCVQLSRQLSGNSNRPPPSELRARQQDFYETGRPIFVCI